MTDINSIQQEINRLISRLTFHSSYHSFLSGSLKYLLVEGNTDAEFIRDQLKSDVVCDVANKAFPPSAEANKNWKKAIAYVVFGLTVVPLLITCPPDCKNIQLYGMVDLDFDESQDYIRVPHLFVTDTHDLETLMLSTDNELLQKLDQCNIPEEDMNTAYLMAYELGTIKSFISDFDYPYSCLSGDSVIIPYGDLFSADGRIILSSLIEYLCQNDREASNAKKQKAKKDKFIKSKQVKKYFKDDLWKIGKDDFDYHKTNDFWDIVNGHDILRILKYLNADVALQFSTTGTSLDREFESALIDKYDYSKLAQTNMFKKMLKENIVNAI